MGDVSNLAMNWRSVMMAMACLPAVICAVILLFRKTEAVPTKLLAGFLLVIVLSMGPQIIGFAGFYDVWPGLTYFPLFYLEAWAGPLLYLHADRLMRSGPVGWRIYLFIPGLVQFIYYLWAFFGLGDYQQKWAYNKSFHAPYILPIESAIEVVLILFAFVMIWRQVGRYRHYLRFTSSAAVDYDPNWLRNILAALFVGGSVYVALEVANAIKSLSYYAVFPFQVFIMLVLSWLAIDATWRLIKPFPKIASEPTQMPVNAAPSADSSSGNLPSDTGVGDKQSVDVESLKQRVIAEQWFLESRLSIRDLANRMATNETYLSRALNQGLNQNFNAFVNRLRIDHAKALITSSDESVLSIGLSSGFNSKATFNRVFRELTGMTPTQFRKSQ